MEIEAQAGEARLIVGLWQAAREDEVCIDVLRLVGTDVGVGGVEDAEAGNI